MHGNLVRIFPDRLCIGIGRPREELGHNIVQIVCPKMIVNPNIRLIPLSVADIDLQIGKDRRRIAPLVPHEECRLILNFLHKFSIEGKG